jgi:hypothetical protein
VRIERIWAMPNSRTFNIKPIADLLKEEQAGVGNWVDPFSGGSNLAQFTNDLNPQIKADYHEDALDFLKRFPDNKVDGVLYDPPYSVRQVAECYKMVGIPVTQETTRSDFYTKIKLEIARITKRGGKVISFGWNSGGIGKTLGFEMTRILLVPSGGIHNDTIVTVEIKI